MSTQGTTLGRLVYEVDAKLDEAEKKLADFEKRWASKALKIRVEIDPSSISRLSSAIAAAVGGPGMVGGGGSVRVGSGGSWGPSRGWMNAFEALGNPAIAAAPVAPRVGGPRPAAPQPFRWGSLGMGLFGATINLGEAKLQIRQR